MTFKDYGRMLRHQWRLILAALVLALGLAFAAMQLLPKTYEATAASVVGVNGANTIDEVNSASNFLSTVMDTYTEVAGSMEVIEPASRSVDPGLDPTSIDFTVMRVPKSTVIQITVADSDPDRAAKLANAMANQLESQLPKVVTLSPKSSAQVTVERITTAVRQPSPASPDRKLILAVALALGGVVGLTAAVQREKRRRAAELAIPARAFE